MNENKKNQEFHPEAIISENAGVNDIYEKTSCLGRIRKFSGALYNYEYSYLAFAFLVPALIMYLIYVAMEIHPFGDGSVLVLDLNGQYVYFYEALRNFIYGDTSLLYSFSRALGGEFMGIYGYYIASPFSYIVALFPQDKILEALLCIFLVKCGISGATFAFYLHKTSRKPNKVSIIIFSTMYALTSYAVVQQHNSMWIDALMWLPILTYSIEELIKNKKYKLFVFILSLSVMSNFYIGYMVCLYVAIYFMYYYFANNENGLNNPLKEKLHFLRSLSRIALASLLAIGISAVIVLTSYYSLTFGKTDFSNPNWGFFTKFDFLDFLTKFLPGTYDTVRVEGLPFVYCGVISIILIPIYFITNKISVREKIFSGVFIVFFLLSFILNPLNLIWHGFQNPNWLNYRNSFILCFFLLVLAYKGFENLKSVSGKTVLGISSVIAIVVMFLQKFSFDSYVLDQNKGEYTAGKLQSFQTIWFALIALAIYMILLCMIIKSQSSRTFTAMISLFVCAELFLNGLICDLGLGADVAYSSYSSYNNFIGGIRPIVETVKDSDDSFYRMEKTHHRKVNDNMALDIRGLTNSTSTLNSDTIAFLKHFGYSSKSHWSKYNGGNPLSDSLLGIKYIITQNEVNKTYYPETVTTNDFISEYYSEFASDENYNAYLNKYALSIGYAVSSDIRKFTFTDISGISYYSTPYEKLNAFVTAMLGKEETIEVFSPIKLNTTDIQGCLKSSIAEHYKYVPSSSDRDAIISYTITAPKDGQIYFYLPSDYPREVELALNGKSYGTFYGSDSTRSIFLGTFKKGEIIELQMYLTTTVLYVKQDANAFFYFNQDVFEDAINELSQTQFIVDENYSEDNLTGKITTTQDEQTVLLTIPYDSGWIVTVDGKEVNTRETANALITFNIAGAGEHDISVKYRPLAFTLGLTVTLLSTAIFIVLLFFDKRLKSSLSKIRIFALASSEKSGSNTSNDLPDNE